MIFSAMKQTIEAKIPTESIAKQKNVALKLSSLKGGSQF